MRRIASARWLGLAAWAGLLWLGVARADDSDPAAPPTDWFSIEVLPPGQTLEDVSRLTERATAALARPASKAEWEKTAEAARRHMLDNVIFRGVPAAWRTGRPRVEPQGEIAGGSGYRIRKLRYEALPGLWVPALLYEPERLEGRVPVGLAVNGHDPLGKAAKYKQLRCINMAKRGMLALNVEWLGMGQLRSADNSHGRMNQLELSGISGLAPFYLVMERGLDVLLDHAHADPERVAVSGLSGGGWQTIFISALDPRVTLSNPVAGYSSFVTRARHHSDLGDSEQTPTDMAVGADYTHLTALRAPRPTLLTYNVKDDCCFASAHALPPLLESAQPIFQLYNADDRLRHHVNHEPGTHNFEKDNREAYYRMLAAFFAPPGKPWPEAEIPSDDEVKSAEELNIPLPESNATFHSLAMAAAEGLPSKPAWPSEPANLDAWRAERLADLRRAVRWPSFAVAAQALGSETEGPWKATRWRLRLDDTWTIGVLELIPSTPKGTAILVGDQGRAKLESQARERLQRGQRVLLVDPFYWGECTIKQRGYLFALLVNSVGQRPLGVQAGQLAAVARWAQTERRLEASEIVAVGPRASLATLVAAALEPRAVSRVELRGTYGSLREVLEQNLPYEQAPEVFCFGLLAAADVRSLIGVVAPREVSVVEPSDRARRELTDLAAWYETLGKSFDPVASHGTK